MHEIISEFPGLHGRVVLKTSDRRILPPGSQSSPASDAYGDPAAAPANYPSLAHFPFSGEYRYSTPYGQPFFFQNPGQDREFRSHVLFACLTVSEPACTLSARTVPPHPGVANVPSVYIDFEMLEIVHDRTLEVNDLLRAAIRDVEERKRRISKKLKNMWDENPDLRRRGLAGGVARKARRGKPYIPIGQVSGEAKRRRLEVEARDVKARNKLAGLSALKVVFDEGYCLLQKFLIACDVLATYPDKTQDGSATEQDMQRA